MLENCSTACFHASLGPARQGEGREGKLPANQICEHIFSHLSWRATNGKSMSNFLATFSHFPKIFFTHLSTSVAFLLFYFLFCFFFLILFFVWFFWLNSLLLSYGPCIGRQIYWQIGSTVLFLLCSTRWVGQKQKAMPNCCSSSSRTNVRVRGCLCGLVCAAGCGTGTVYRDVCEKHLSVFFTACHALCCSQVF